MPSTVIRRFAYDEQAQALEVTFVTGRRYRYRAVPPELVRAFREASSKGRFFNARIRDRFRFEELGGEGG
jgi:lysyl-tRNA synthetase class 2